MAQRPASVCSRLLGWWDGLRGLARSFLTQLKRSRGRIKPKRSIPLQLESLEKRWMMTVVQFETSNFLVGEQSGEALITAQLDAPSSSVVHVNYTTSNGTAVAGTNYTGVSGSLTFTPGQLNATFAVPILDTEDPDDESLNLALSSPRNATLGVLDNATLTIQGMGPSVSFAQLNTNVVQATGTASVTVLLGSVSAQTVTVDYATSDDSAEEGIDYEAASGTLVFAPGETSKTFDVSILDNEDLTTDRTVDLTLSNPQHDWLTSPDNATLTIQKQPAVFFAASNSDALQDSGSTTVTVLLSAASNQTVTVDYATSNGSATAGVDYTASTGTLSFAPGEVSKTFSVAILAEEVAHPDETVNLTLSNPSNATLASPQTATLTLEDDPATPTVSFASSSYLAEESSGSALITVTLSAASTQTVTVQYTPSDGTAQAGIDYTAASGTLTFAPGETSQTFAVNFTGDFFYEDYMTVNLTLSSPGQALLSTPYTATLTIYDDTPPNSGPDNTAVPQDSFLVRVGTPNPTDLSSQASDQVVGSVSSGPFNLTALSTSVSALNSAVASLMAPSTTPTAAPSTEFSPQTGKILISNPIDLRQSTGTPTLGGDPALVFDSSQIDYRPIVTVTVPTNYLSVMPDHFTVILDWGSAAPVSATYYTATGSQLGTTFVLPIQVADPITISGTYKYSVEVDAYLPGSSTPITPVATVNGTAPIAIYNSPFAQGWSMAGLDALLKVSGGVIWYSGSSRPLLHPPAQRQGFHQSRR